MVTVLVWGALGAIIVAAWKYQSWLSASVEPRRFTTGLNADTVRRIFVDAVAGSTWRIVDDGNPMVAQSPILTGMRQQIALTLGPGDGAHGGLAVEVAPTRVVVKMITRVPAKAHTIRLRLNAFEKAIRAADPSLGGTSAVRVAPTGAMSAVPTNGGSRGEWSAASADVDRAPAPMPVAGWYRDPLGRAAARYWDGQTWTVQER